ncbi:MAG: hypothetical protein ACYTGX_16400 [Planctomycetota bacterium]|jgi:hypothetical protein
MIRAAALLLCLAGVVPAAGCAARPVTACTDVESGRGGNVHSCNGHCCMAEGRHVVFYAGHECRCSDACPCWDGKTFGK